MPIDQAGGPTPGEMGILKPIEPDNKDNKVESLSRKDEDSTMAFLEVYGIDSFLSRLKIPLVKPIVDIRKIYTVDDLATRVSENDRGKLKKAVTVASEILGEAHSDPDADIPEDTDLKYKDILTNDSLGQAMFARIVKIRLNK